MIRTNNNKNNNRIWILYDLSWLTMEQEGITALKCSQNRLSRRKIACEKCCGTSIFKQSTCCTIRNTKSLPKWNEALGERKRTIFVILCGLCTTKSFIEQFKLRYYLLDLVGIWHCQFDTTNCMSTNSLSRLFNGRSTISWEAEAK